jgi:N utilization substance protein B
MRRRQGREQALQALYSIAIGRRDPGEVLREIVGEAASPEHRIFVRDLVTGTLEHAKASDETIAPLLQGWTLERLPTLDRLLLEMGTYELQCCPQTPPAVAISEAVELAKKFSTEDSSRFVNGVLNAVAKETAHS